jgi:2,4-dienoyl-CoA reductase-like NADH-dependent reductase (Old Yellow Enzyme family)
MGADARFAHLMEPGRIGTMELRNRIVMCPMGVLYSNEDGSISDNEAAFYEARARGGAGLVMVGTTGITYPFGANHARNPAVSDDRYLPGMVDLAERVHRHGGRIGAQLNFMGTNALLDVAEGRERWVPSKPRRPNPDRLWALMTDEETAASSAPFMVEGSEYRFHVMDEDDIAWMIDRYAEAADRCRRAGYDGVELHAGHGYLIDAFLSPRSTRDDRWGGSLENRARFLLEVLGAVRARVGADFPVWMRVNALERGEDPGETFEDQCTVIRWAVAAGADAVHLTSYANPDSGTGATDSYAPHHAGPLSELAGRVRALVDVPVITYGRYEPDQAEQLLVDGNTDFVAMGRKLLADPDLPRKLAEGRVDDVRPCIYQYQCIGNIALRTPARCVVNPRTGLEHDLRVEPAASAKRVLVVGGGPAGLDCARLLAERGHHVTLREAGPRLGGVLVGAASADPILDPYLGWLIHQVEQADVAIELGAPVDPSALPTGFDHVVVATGARWGVPEVPGGERALSLEQLSSWLARDDDTVGGAVVVLGGSKAALSLADLCRARGRAVTLVAPERWVADTIGFPGRARLVADLEAAGVELLTGATVDSVSPGAVRVAVQDDVRSLPCDTVIGVAPRIEPSPLVDALAASGVAVHRVGDCDRIASLEGATAGALAVALAIG